LSLHNVVLQVVPEEADSEHDFIMSACYTNYLRNEST